jgi:hypothetical protein
MVVVLATKFASKFQLPTATSLIFRVKRSFMTRFYQVFIVIWIIPNFGESRNSGFFIVLPQICGKKTFIKRNRVCLKLPKSIT